MSDGASPRPHETYAARNDGVTRVSSLKLEIIVNLKLDVADTPILVEVLRICVTCFA